MRSICHTYDWTDVLAAHLREYAMGRNGHGGEVDHDVHALAFDVTIQLKAMGWLRRYGGDLSDMLARAEMFLDGWVARGAVEAKKKPPGPKAEGQASRV